MKQLLLFIAITSISSAVHAQLNKGQWLIGGDANYTHINDNAPKDIMEGIDTKFRSYGISPNAGFFVIDKLCTGLRVTASHSSDVSAYADMPEIVLGSDKNTAWGISPFVRYYFLPKAGKVNLLADASYGFVHATNTSENGGYTPNDKYTQGIFTIAAGPAFVINPHISLEVLAEYSTNKTTFENEHSLLINAGFQIHLGK